ncbi:LruC domain-containing protein [Flavobacteriaceae bacterium R38]|nr:LruC domain-containing protein [Flavobacteriaceae bacterium R38]
MKNAFYRYIGILTILISNSCAKPNLNNETIVENPSASVENINIPDGFDFSTHRTVSITINDNSSSKYDVYAYSSQSLFVGTETFENEAGETVTEDVFRNDVFNRLLFSGVAKNGVLEQSVNIPKFYDEVYIRRNDNLNYSASVESISNDQVSYTHNSASSGRSFSIQETSTDNLIVNDYLYCVNGAAELFQVDPLNGDLTFLSTMPQGSFTCAIDQENRLLYSIGRSSPNPLMRYSIDTNTWDIVANLGIGGPRLDFNTEDGLLYFSRNNILYTFDPNNGNQLNTWNINGLDNLSGGDLAFAEDGTLFMCTFSGLYRLELNNNGEYDATRISAESLPFQPTSMTFDSDQNLWLANNSNSSDLIIMDTQTGGFQYVYGPNSDSGVNFGRTINDLTTFRVFTEDLNPVDTDGDGIIDRNDTFPEDANKAFELFTPSQFGTGTVAFEDLWPSEGDYDFNDLALNYQAIAVLNSDNLAVQLDMKCGISSNDAGFINGVGIEIEGITSDLVESVQGPVYSEGYISLNANGTEANQDKAVIIFTDNAVNLTNEVTISIIFTQPITTQALGTAPFNPFIIVNRERENEIHLPLKNSTSLGNNLRVINGQNRDVDGNYIGESGYPWAISIAHEFRVPRPNIRVDEAYNNFKTWAESGGQQFTDWFTDRQGYRNSEKLKN